MDALGAQDVAAWRRRFPVLSRCTYLANHSLGAMPDTVPAALQEFSRQWGTDGVEAWGTDWLPRVARVADVLAELLGAPAGSVVLHQNVATLTAMALSAVSGGSRSRVVMTDLEWPSHRYLLEQRGLDVRIVPTDGIEVDIDRLTAAIDDQTLLVITSHVLFRSSAITDVAAVAARAREVGALSLIDGYHALGHMPVDVREIGCDLYVGGSVKWLCGGPGVGYLYVRPESGLAATDVGWLGHARPFDFADEWEATAGAAGWLGGTPSMPAIFAAEQGYRMIAEVGPASVRATSEVLTRHLVEGALDRGIAVRSPMASERRAGSVTLDLGEGTDAAALRLIEQGIIVDHRPGAGIRVGPHFFNTVEECEALLEALAARS